MLYGFGRNRQAAAAQVAGFLSQRLHVPGATAAFDPWQRDLPGVDTPTFKDVPRSVRSQLNDCPIPMQFRIPGNVRAAPAHLDG
jgi:hypothetical protein